MLRALRRWLRRTPRAPSTRLREEDVVAIAHEAARTEAERKDLTMVTLIQREGRAVWIVSTAGIGCTFAVEIDDASGLVLERKWYGGR